MTVHRRESHLVELVDPDGSPVGESTVDVAHQAPGRLHRAFSVLLVDERGRMLLQQRALGKTRFAMRWANACCGHPRPGQAVADAAARRLAEELGLVAEPGVQELGAKEPGVEELGVAPVRLDQIGVYLYRASDPATERVEYEYDHVLIGRVDSNIALAPDPDEVHDLDWVHPARLIADIAVTPDRFAPWLGGVLAIWAQRSEGHGQPAGRQSVGGVSA